MDITPNSPPFIQLFTRWITNGLRTLTRIIFWGLIISLGITILYFGGKILWFFISLLLYAIGGF